MPCCNSNLTQSCESFIMTPLVLPQLGSCFCAQYSIMWQKKNVVLQCCFFFPLKTPRALSANILSFTMVTYNNFFSFLLSFSESVETMMLSVLYVIFVKKLYIWFKFLGIHVFKWGTNMGTGWLRNWDSFVVHHYSKSIVVAPCRWSRWTIIIWLYCREWKETKIKRQ